ncbi:sensor histidine kinase [Actinobacteria bacterium YIM 96077]|uniref:histidine kinase n=1 Tax=Phytoactinopolyspora halophila TaxID=1981511 RepID=A0A329QJQ9_9ACTN|nr:sensor histidine kinase [Phytoactinopolyspora halophila]AYY12594.1 sensor histidine kinase [Actinobacteria bacterium YIM 96077]RAW12503.1 sensor histidine kinase [Phytoactinopolyspora halophila]
MTITATDSDGVRSAPGTALRALWSARTWRATTHLVTGLLIGLASFVGVFLLVAATFTLAPTLVGAVLSMALLLVVNRALTALQRSRFAAFLNLQIQRPAAPVTGEPFVRRTLRGLGAGSTWRQLGYHVLAGVFGVLAGAIAIAVWSAGLTFPLAFLYTQAWGGISLAAGAASTVTGLVLLFAAPWIVRTLAMADAAIAQALLSAESTEELTHRVVTLAASREGVVDAADTERRRIERDLHDGAQQRLTSLAMNLGIARASLADAPEPARDVIAQAHDEAKHALVELRDVVRGMHPAVLDDRGLDAALSGLAARSPVPVRLDVQMPERAAREVEAVAYFVVSEALTNATTHAHASSIDVRVKFERDRLQVTVTDDGNGGADPARGTGLDGLRKRVSSVDGTLHISSPPGGPTTLTAEMPCAL